MLLLEIGQEKNREFGFSVISRLIENILTAVLGMFLIKDADCYVEMVQGPRLALELHVNQMWHIDCSDSDN